MRAISALMRDAGMSTRVCLAITALRIRASMSAIGSVITPNPQTQLGIWRISELVNSPVHRFANSPTTLGHSRDVAFQRQLAEAQAAQRELAHVGPRPSAQMAPVAQANLVFRRFVLFRDLRCCGHDQFWRNGIPMNCNNLRASSSVFAVVTTDTFMPRALSTFM